MKEAVLLNQASINVTDVSQHEDDLITYREFMAALRSLKGQGGEYSEECN